MDSEGVLAAQLPKAPAQLLGNITGAAGRQVESEDHTQYDEQHKLNSHTIAFKHP